jgi:hypothetical protein
MPLVFEISWVNPKTIELVFEIGWVNPKTIELVCAASLLSIQY